MRITVLILVIVLGAVIPFTAQELLVEYIEGTLELKQGARWTEVYIGDLLAPGSVIRLEANGTVVGLMPEACYRQDSIRLRRGDIFCAFTDGVTEAVNVGGEEFGHGRLVDALLEHASSTAEEASRLVLAAIDRFTAGAPQRDDVTLIVGKVR